MKKVKEKEAPDLSSLLVFGYACKLFRWIPFSPALLIACRIVIECLDGGPKLYIRNLGIWSMVMKSTIG